MSTAKKFATYEDLCELPDTVIAQIVHGVLHSHPRPAPRHAVASSALGGGLDSPFRRGRGGPGGWVILDEPELHLGRDILVPDLAGWRRARMPEIPVDRAYFVLSPDWVAEVLSPSTASLDRGDKLSVYVRENVTHVWFVEPEGKTLEVLRLDGATYRIVAVFSGDSQIRAEPFDAVEIDLGSLWAL